MFKSSSERICVAASYAHADNWVQPWTSCKGYKGYGCFNIVLLAGFFSRHFFGMFWTATYL